MKTSKGMLFLVEIYLFLLHYYDYVNTDHYLVVGKLWERLLISK
jgi:hypothetical protein